MHTACMTWDESSRRNATASLLCLLNCAGLVGLSRGIGEQRTSFQSKSVKSYCLLENCSEEDTPLPQGLLEAAK
ncbi:Hypothetical predicted protein [Podarcis lilfordi]|uniref:Uncharacterized protein n=1 Tax=Podarcis lilfordi TaxID=74358 RepID=A0AA35JYD3_9SAUR|nr:Hypothetical predicted protein [Podarcis lilfordi]